MPLNSEMQTLETQPFEVKLPLNSSFINTAVDLIASTASNYGLDQKHEDDMKNKAYSAASWLLSRNGGAHRMPVPVKIWRDGEGLHIEFRNQNEPLAINPKEPNQLGITIKNAGRKGQILYIFYPNSELNEGFLQQQDDSVSDQGIRINSMDVSSAPLLSRLFYQVYGYDYINDFIYYPRKIIELMENNDLSSFVAENSRGELLAHVGLQRWNENPVVYEASLGVVDPRIKSKGLFREVFAKTMEYSDTLKMSYCLFDFVTNHAFSQGIIKDYGIKELALFVGCQSKKTQAKLERLGLGSDPKDMNRYTLLVGVIPREPYPFGKEVMIPSNIGEKLGFLLEELNIDWVPTPRFYPLPEMGRFEKEIQETQKSIVYRIDQPSFDVLKKIKHEWIHALADGYQYVAVDVPLNQPGISQCYDYLAEQGFFFAGFVPYKYGNQLALRLQSIAPTHVAFDKIQVSSEIGQRLLDIIKQNYQRNRRL